jgi:hypothetical protein
VAENGRGNLGEGRRRCEAALIAALSAGAGIAKAAQHAGVSERTVYRRLADAGFRARVDRARAEVVEQVVSRLVAVGALATKTLKKLLRESESESIRLGAARAALDFMLRGHEYDTFRTSGCSRELPPQTPPDGRAVGLAVAVGLLAGAWAWWFFSPRSRHRCVPKAA